MRHELPLRVLHHDRRPARVHLVHREVGEVRHDRQVDEGGAAGPFVRGLRLGEIGRLANLPRPLVDYRLHAASLTNVFSRRQRVNALRAVADARSRRGQPSTPIELPGSSVAISPYCSWANFALASGHFSAARRLAAAGVDTRQFSAVAWYIFLTATFGRQYERARAGLKKWGDWAAKHLRRR